MFSQFDAGDSAPTIGINAPSTSDLTRSPSAAPTTTAIASEKMFCLSRNFLNSETCLLPPTRRNAARGSRRAGVSGMQHPSKRIQRRLGHRLRARRVRVNGEVDFL